MSFEGGGWTEKKEKEKQRFALCAKAKAIGHFGATAKKVLFSHHM